MGQVAVIGVEVARRVGSGVTVAVASTTTGGGEGVGIEPGVPAVARVGAGSMEQVPSG